MIDLELMIKDFGEAGAWGRVAYGPSGEECPARFAVVTLSGMFPGMVLANPGGGNYYYSTRDEAERAAEKIRTNHREGRKI